MPDEISFDVQPGSQTGLAHLNGGNVFTGVQTGGRQSSTTFQVVVEADVMREP